MTSNNKFLHVLNLPTGEIFTNQSDRIPSNQDLIAVDKATFFQQLGRVSFAFALKWVISYHDYRAQRIMLLYADSSEEEEMDE